MSAMIKILIADDEDVILNIMAAKIRAEGYYVIPASDGEEAWAKIVSEEPDVIVLDLTMPKMDGWEVLRRVRQESPSKKWQPVIIVSASNTLEHVDKGLKLEADHYLTKPCRMEDIIKAIRLMVALIPQRN